MSKAVKEKAMFIFHMNNLANYGMSPAINAVCECSKKVDQAHVKWAAASMQNMAQRASSRMSKTLNSAASQFMYWTRNDDTHTAASHVS